MPTTKDAMAGVEGLASAGVSPANSMHYFPGAAANSVVERQREISASAAPAQGVKQIPAGTEKRLMFPAHADGWRPIKTAPRLDRVLVAGWVNRSGQCAGYWYYGEDATDERGVPMDHPNALMWMPWPEPPNFIPPGAIP